MLAAEVIGEVYDPRRSCRNRGRHDVVELADIAAHHLNLLAQMPVRGRAGIDVHADDFFAALRQ